MTKNDYFKCIVSIMNFIVFSNDELKEENNFNTVSNKRMTKVLKEFGYDMLSFTEKLTDEKLWKDSPKEFFSDHDKAISFLSSKLNNKDFNIFKNRKIIQKYNL